MPHENCSPVTGGVRGHTRPAVLKSLVGAAEHWLWSQSGHGNPATLSAHEFDPVIHPLSGSLSASSCKICSLCSTDITWSIRNLGRWEPRRESAAQGQKGHAYGGLTKALPSSALPAAALRIWKSLACSRPQTPPSVRLESPSSSGTPLPRCLGAPNCTHSAARSPGPLELP